ncbi:MAG: hypothetical protein A2428_01375 [Bdellovibrionales bacterium RIFOXYC1_FULL_54_43]|nr:MAG: hypothetical protein A2428_01375 [Bdellovibrionales bacterium RIFOXYC1_FULL_54_43]OFZ85250.1 MAG: hypothetical protein A2603_08130 [Bdellovibrionales bacterium RIFOXYD1_FULL_55_31]
MKRPTLLRALLFVPLCAIAVFGCSPSRVPDSNKSKTTRVADLRVFRFDYKTATQLVIEEGGKGVKDPEWSVRLQKNESGNWQFTSAPEGTTLLDRRADTVLIDHLLDTISTAQRVTSISTGTPESLGLVPPRFAFRWLSKAGEMELRIGNPAGDATQHAEMQGLAFASAPPNPEIFTIRGSVLKMLAHIASFETLRQRTWATFPADDVDELELFTGPSHRKTLLYAQREGDVWTDRKHKPVKAQVEPFLEWLTTFKVAEFIDDEKLAHKLAGLPVAYHEIRLTDRHGKATIFRLKDLRGKKTQPEIVGTLSTRPGAVAISIRDYERIKSFFSSGRSGG